MTTMARVRSWQGPALLSYGFRPLFLLGSIYAALLILLWVPAFLGLITISTALPPGAWHAHELLFGFLPAVIAEKVCYNAGYTNVHELIPWRTLTGRQQLYQDHLWMRAFGEGFCVYRPPIDTKSVNPAIEAKSDGRPHVVLNFITPHQKWGIHSTYSDNLMMLTLNRGGPVVWISETDAGKAGLVDNDWVEVYNANGAIVARVVVSQRMKEGTIFMYHAQEKIVNTPGSQLTQQRGGIHNSVTRAITKPTHMIGGYAQQSYGFNYYGTVGSNRDEFVVVHKLEKVDWMEGPTARRRPV